MEESVADLKLKQLEDNVNNLMTKIEKLPDEVSQRVDESVKLKIEVATKDLEMRFFKWVVGLAIGVIGSLISTVISFIK